LTKCEKLCVCCPRPLHLHKVELSIRPAQKTNEIDGVRLQLSHCLRYPSGCCVQSLDISYYAVFPRLLYATFVNCAYLLCRGKGELVHVRASVSCRFTVKTIRVKENSTAYLSGRGWFQVPYKPAVKTGNVKQTLERPRGFQEVEAPRFHDNRHKKVVKLSTLRTGRL